MIHQKHNPLRFHEPHAHLAAPFGADSFGRTAEKMARLFGTPVYLVTQTALVIAWIAVNAAAAALRWDPYPFILLNLAFSTQAAYAAPLILLAQTRQSERDKAYVEADALHREELQNQMLALLQTNTDLTQQIADLTKTLTELTQEIHEFVCPPQP